VTRQVSDVQDIEYLSDKHQLVFFAKDERAAQAQILSQVVVAKLVIGGQGDLRDRLIAWRATACEILVKLLDDSTQIFFSQAPVKPVHTCAWERVSVSSITVEIQASDKSREWQLAVVGRIETELKPPWQLDYRR